MHYIPRCRERPTERERERAMNRYVNEEIGTKVEKEKGTQERKALFRERARENK